MRMSLKRSSHKVSEMALRENSPELPLPSTLDARGVDRLLAKLRAAHGKPRFDIAPELKAETRVTARRVSSAEMVPST
jgi:hypothetical protein